MKRIVYISLCTFLFIMLSFIVHVLIEIPIIFLMVSDMAEYSLGLSWGALMTVHYVFTITLLILGAIIGIKMGKKWWKYIYVDKKYTGRFFKK